MQEQTPRTPSSDYEAMVDYWNMVEAMLGGAKAMRSEGVKYLPKFENEQIAAYQKRLKNAKFTNIYRDIVENLAQRPFAKEVQIAEGAPQSITDFIEDVDGRGNHIHVFAGEVFFAGLNAAVDWIMVDYTSGVPEGATRSQEAAMGVRPYWVRIPATSMLAVYSAMVNGKEEFIHARISENETVRDGYGEKTIERVRVLNREALENGDYGPATYEVLEKHRDTKGVENWVPVDGGVISIGIIPLVPFCTGRRVVGSWRFHPPMKDAAYLQIEHYQQESALKHIEELTAFPMLAGNGVSPPIGDDGKPAVVPVGPQAVLYAPPNQNGAAGNWAFIEPDATSLRFLLDHIKETAQELRELGRQPLTAQSGNLTVVTTAFAAQKGNSAIQAWALNLKDALERAFQITSLWLKEAYSVEVKIDTDFDLGFGDDSSFDHLIKLYEQETISRETLLAEAKRRGIVSAEFDEEADLQDILREMGDEGDELGPRVDTQPRNAADAAQTQADA